MSLLHPEFLYALAALALPIIIHLFNFRRFKKVVFPNVRFLKEVDLRTKSKNKLKHLLVLFSRLLAITCLVMAFCRPFIPAAHEEKAVAERQIAVYVDNSFSMNLENEKGNLRAQSIDLAESIVDAFGTNDRFLLLTNDLKSEHQRVVNKDEFKESLSSITESPSSRSYSEIYERASDILKDAEGKGKKLFFISDFQEQVFDPINTRVDSTMNTSLIKLAHGGQGNVYIDSLWFESPVRNTHSPERLGVRVVNASAKDLFDIPLRLSIDGVQRSLGVVTMRPYSSVDSILTFTNESTGWKEGVVSIDDHPITFDDDMHFSYQVHEECKVLVVGPREESNIVERIFINDPFYQVEHSEYRAVNMGELRNQDFIVLTELQSISSGLTRELSKFVKEGGSLCILPDAQADILSLNELLLALNANTVSGVSDRTLKVSSIDTEHLLFQDVFDQIPSNIDLPGSVQYLSFNNRVQSSEEKILRFQDGSSFLSSFQVEKGELYLFASGLKDSQSSLASHSIFITSLLRMAELSAGEQVIYQQIGSDTPVNLRLGEQNADQVYSFTGDNAYTFIPEQRILGSQTQFYERGQVQESGTYKVTLEEVEKARVSYNFDRQESNMEFMSESEAIEDLERNGILDISFISLDEFSSGWMSNNALTGTQLWRYFILAALLFLGIEVLLLKYWKS